MGTSPSEQTLAKALKESKELSSGQPLLTGELR